MADEIKLEVKCKNCQHAEVHGGKQDKTVICVRFPPVPLIVPHTNQQGVRLEAIFPKVGEDWHCGEYKTKVDICN